MLFEVAAFLLVDEDEVQEVADRELFVDVAHGWGKLVSGEKDADGNVLASHRRPVHDLVLGYHVLFVVRVRTYDQKKKQVQVGQTKFTISSYLLCDLF